MAVSDKRLEELIETCGWRAESECTDTPREDFEDLAILLKELQQRRAQTCETCASWCWRPKEYDDHSHCGLNLATREAGDYCSSWKAKEADDGTGT